MNAKEYNFDGSVTRDRMELTMKPLRVAVLIDQEILAGGGYQQALNAAILLKKVPDNLVTPVYFTNKEDNIEKLKHLGIAASYLPPISLIKKIIFYLRLRLNHPRLGFLLKVISWESPLESFLLKNSIDLVYVTAPMEYARYFNTLNFLYTVWDISHRDTPEFPEVRGAREFERREKLYRETLPKATAIFVDSAHNRNSLSFAYGIDIERIYVMPFSPALATTNSEFSHQNKTFDVRLKYNLNCQYIFYPAQFWSHKNHIYLLEGLKFLKRRYGHDVGVIFSGGEKGNLKYIMQQVERTGLSDRVRFVGFVPNEEIPYLYRQSLALVMPTYFGPTNLPPLEAFCLGVPVLYPDRPGLREQVGNAALLMDLDRPSSMAAHLDTLITNPIVRDNLVTMGYRKIAELTDERRVDTLINIFKRYQSIRTCWS